MLQALDQGGRLNRDLGTLWHTPKAAIFGERMRALFHIGLNKCASTYVQTALDGARPRLATAGTWYPAQDGPPCQYGLSRAYGFGPDDRAIAMQSLSALAEEADRHGCEKLILSSEYFSLYAPRAIDRLLSDIEALGIRADYLVFSRDLFDWVRALFNQYIKTVEGARPLKNLDAFVDQVLANGAIDVGKRIGAWQARVPQGALLHYRLPSTGLCAQILAPFEHFAGCSLDPPAAAVNPSLNADTLYRIGKLRQEPSGPARDAEISSLINGAQAPVQAPHDYLEIGYDRRARLMLEVSKAYYALPRLDLPEAHKTKDALPAL